MRIDELEKLARFHLMDDDADAPIYVRVLEFSSSMRRHIVPSGDNLSLAVALFCRHWRGSLSFGGDISRAIGPSSLAGLIAGRSLASAQ